MSQRQQVLSMHAMLEHVAQEAARGGYGLLATLSAAAAEAARQELVTLERLDRRHNPPDHPARKVGVKEDSFA